MVLFKSETKRVFHGIAFSESGISFVFMFFMFLYLILMFSDLLCFLVCLGQVKIGRWSAKPLFGTDTSEINSGCELQTWSRQVPLAGVVIFLRAVNCIDLSALESGWRLYTAVFKQSMLKSPMIWISLFFRYAHSMCFSSRSSMVVFDGGGRYNPPLKIGLLKLKGLYVTT